MESARDVYVVTVGLSVIFEEFLRKDTGRFTYYIFICYVLTYLMKYNKI
jgi:hypothetical protein